MLKLVATVMVLCPMLASTASAHAEPASAAGAWGVAAPGSRPSRADAPVLLAQAATPQEAPPADAVDGTQPEDDSGPPETATQDDTETSGEPADDSSPPETATQQDTETSGEPASPAEPEEGNTESSATTEPTAAPDTPPSAPSSAEIGQGMLDAHARIRAAVGVGPLTWSAALASHAQEWTDRLSTSGCTLNHRTGPDRQGYGENLFATSGRASPAEVVGSWESEKPDYDYATNTCAAGKACGHYTQIVWRNSTEVGCGVSICGNGNQIWACNYGPAGNVQGEKPY
jgi:uncharacterized protein YkwD